MWKKLAELYGWPIPPEEMDRLGPVLDSLESQTRKALDRDLSTIEPAGVFRPGDESLRDAKA